VYVVIVRGIGGFMEKKEEKEIPVNAHYAEILRLGSNCFESEKAFKAWFSDVYGYELPKDMGMKLYEELKCRIKLM
jgi:hypothetical protein